METIGEQKVFSFANKANYARPATCTTIRSRSAHSVKSFMDLATKVATLQFMNRDFVLLFRGQTRDHKNQLKNTSLKSSLFRPTKRVNPDANTIEKRFEMLRSAEDLLVQEYSGHRFFGRTRLIRQKILRWSILQHYEVCPTPLLDVTHSLRVAASFASDGANDEAFVFVLGVPNLSGAVTASAEAGIQIVRLSSVCPPEAVRPHIQEGYLLGEYPEMTGYDQKQHYGHYEVDFGQRLVAKFKFNPKTFWRDRSFPRIETSALYPNRNDPLFSFTQGLKKALGNR